MEMLKVRNELTHDYDCEIVKTHCDAIVKKYIDLFYIFADKVKQLGIALIRGRVSLLDVVTTVYRKVF